MLDLSNLMQEELGKVANRTSQGIRITNVTAASKAKESSGDRNSTVLPRSCSNTDASTSSPAATPEPDDASPKDSRFSMLNPFDLLLNGGAQQSARQVSDSSSTQGPSSGSKQSAVTKSRIARPHQQSVPTAARSSGKYVYYGSEEPVCGHCGVYGHRTGVCQVKLCKHCGKFGHANGNCSDACPTCGRFHKNKPHGYNCNGQRCTACGLYGHFEVACPNIPCTACGNLGHRHLECQGGTNSVSSINTVPVASGAPAQPRTVPASWGCVRLQKDLSDEQQHQQGQQLLRKLQPIAPKYSKGLAQNPHKLSVLSRISPADVVLLLQLPLADVVMHLDAVYTHYLAGAASGGVKPHQLRAEHVRQFEAAMQEIAPNYLPTNWHKADNWPANSDVIRSLGVDKAQQYKHVKGQVQVAAYKASIGAGGRREQIGNVGQASSAGLAPEQQQQQLTSDEHFPRLSSAKQQGSYAAAAAVPKPAWQTQQQEQQQQQPDARKEPEPAAGPHHQQPALEEQVTGELPSAVGPQQQHHDQHPHNTAAVCESEKLPGLIAAICSSLHNMLVQLRDGQVQLEQPFADQLLHVAELAGRAKQLTDWHQQENSTGVGTAISQLQQDAATGTQPSAPAVAQHVVFTQGAVAAQDGLAAAASAGVVASGAGQCTEDEDELALLGLLIG